jgi:chitin synthase
MIHDKKLLCVCGETELANGKQSLITMMQVSSLKFYLIGMALIVCFRYTNTSFLITWRSFRKSFRLHYLSSCLFHSLPIADADTHKPLLISNQLIKRALGQRE